MANPKDREEYLKNSDAKGANTIIILIKWAIKLKNIYLCLLVSASFIKKNLIIWALHFKQHAQNNKCNWTKNAIACSVAKCSARRATTLKVHSSIPDWGLRKVGSFFLTYGVDKMSDKLYWEQNPEGYSLVWPVSSWLWQMLYSILGHIFK